MKILFLDDDKNRLAVASKKWSKDHDLTLVETADEAIEALTNNQFDLASLDHDLGGKVYVESSKGTGYEVAQFICTMETPPPIVIVHSWNFYGAQNMLSILKEVTETDYQRFEV